MRSWDAFTTIDGQGKKENISAFVLKASAGKTTVLR
jgi:hypothetical protein